MTYDRAGQFLPATTNRSNAVLQMIRDAAAHQGISYGSVLAFTHEPKAVAARAEVFQRLAGMGWSRPRIGRAFGLHHSTVTYHVNAALHERHRVRARDRKRHKAEEPK